MAELIAVGFKGIHRASEVLGQINELDEDWVIEVRDAVSIYRTNDGRLRVDQSVLATSGEGAGWGVLLGGILGGLLAAPVAAVAGVAGMAAVGVSAITLGATGAVIGAEDSASWKRDYGISEEFTREVGGMVQPGDSAVLVLARAANPDAAVERFRGYGGKVLRTTLSAEAARKLKQTLAVEGAGVR